MIEANLKLNVHQAVESKPENGVGKASQNENQPVAENAVEEGTNENTFLDQKSSSGSALESDHPAEKTTIQDQNVEMTDEEAKEVSNQAQNNGNPSGTVSDEVTPKKDQWASLKHYNADAWRTGWLVKLFQ